MDNERIPHLSLFQIEVLACPAGRDPSSRLPQTDSARICDTLVEFDSV